jgi:glucose-6-phosphate isomerase
MAISFDYSNALSFMQKSEVDRLSEFVKIAHGMLHDKKDLVSDFLGWVDLPIHYVKTNLNELNVLVRESKIIQMLLL